MDTPVFRLEGIIRAKNETQDFEGPLALILQLLSKNKIEIKDISVSLILEQYLEYLGKMTELNLEIASEFVSMASHLAYIKTKMLLNDGAEITELEQLISSLEELRRGDIYIQIKAASSCFAEMYLRGGAMMVKPQEYLPTDTGYAYSHTKEDLLEAISRVIGREDAKRNSINLKETVYPQKIVYSVPEKISEILLTLRQRGEMSVLELFYESRSRTEIVATLIAVLELCKVGGVTLYFGEDGMTIGLTGTGIQDYQLSIE